MAGFEDVILRALERHDATSPEMREQIYHSARKALTGMLGKTPDMNPADADEERRQLEVVIAGIESRYRVVEPVQPEIPAPEVLMESGPVPISESPIYEDLEDNNPALWRHPFAKMLFVAIVLAGFGIAAWWAYDQNLFESAASRDTSVPNPPRVLEAEDYQETLAGQPSNTWIAVFEPGDPRELMAGGSLAAELGQDDGGAFVSLKGEEGSSENLARIVIEPGVMESIRGRKATFDLKVKSPEGKGHQFVVTCQFGPLGDCGRKRFTATQLAESFLFEVVLKDKAVEGDQKSGILLINTDFSGAGRALDLYSVRVAVE